MSVIVGTAEGYILPRVRLADNDVVSTIVEVTEGYILLRMCLGGSVVSIVVERVNIVNMLAEIADVVGCSVLYFCVEGGGHSNE